MDGNSTKNFENARWEKNNQTLEYRHKAGLALLPDEINTLLDIGCGEGTFLSLVNKKMPGVSLFGVDLSEVAVALAKKKVPNSNLKVLDVTDEFPFGSNSFDVVVALDVLEHVLDPEEILIEMFKISKKYLIISVPNFNSLPARIQTLFGFVPENNRPNKGHVYWFNKKVLYDMFSKNNLIVVKEMVNFQLQEKKIIGMFMSALAKAFPSLFGLSFVVLLEKKIT